MSTHTDVVEIVDIFASIPLAMLDELAKQRYLDGIDGRKPGEQREYLFHYLQRAISLSDERKKADRDYVAAVYSVASELYHNEEDLQINVDPLQAPYDIAESENGVWAHAWVWVPEEAVKAELAELRPDSETGDHDEHGGEEGTVPTNTGSY